MAVKAVGGIASEFWESVTSEIGVWTRRETTRKPHLAPLHYACNALSVAPARTLFFGDSRNNAEAAQAAHMRMVGMSYGYNEGMPAITLHCAALLDDMAGLPALVRALGAPGAT